MTNTTSSRSGALAGIGFLALGLLGTVVQSGQPGFAAEPKAIAAHYADEATSVLAGSTMYLVGAVLLLWFVSALRARMQHAAGADDVLPALAYAGGVGGATLCMAAAAANAMGALRAEERGAIDPAVATTLADLSGVLYGLAAPMAFAALVLAVATVALRTGFLPKWLAIVSLPLGIALVLPPVSYLAMNALNFWIAGVGALLALARGAAPATSPVTARPTAA